jgi:hypothetical protein
MCDRASAMNAHKQCALKEWWAGLHLAERESEFTAAARQAGLLNKLHPKLELAESVAVPNPSSDPSEV